MLLRNHGMKGVDKVMMKTYGNAKNTRIALPCLKVGSDGGNIYKRKESDV